MSGDRDNDIINCLAQSDGEDFIPSDEDMDDPAYTPEDEHMNETQSDSSEEEISTVTGTLLSRGRVRGRASRSRRGPLSRPHISASGSTTTEWTARNFSVAEYAMLLPSYFPNIDDNFDKITFLKQYLDDDIMEIIVNCTNRTSVALHGRSLNLTTHELYIYIGITFVMAALKYPWLRMYWENKWRVPIIADNMSRNRFTLLRNSLKVVYDDDITEEIRQLDRLWKVRPLINRIKYGCQLQEKQQRLSLDEMIIPFTGSCGMKQYCPGKPNPVGLKAFVLANPDGLITDFDVYQGSETTYPELKDSNFGLGEKAVLTLANSLVPGHILYFDRYFTSLKLAKELLARGIRCTGTIQKNRVPATAKTVLIDDKQLAKQNRGSAQTVVSEDGTTAIIKWFDNKPVTMMSTVEGEEPSDICQRWCKRTKQYVSVNRPLAVRNYNKFMGGVDLADRLLSVCPSRYRTKKWTQRFLSHMLDLAVTNAWLQFKKRELKREIPLKKIQQLRGFKMELGEYLIDMYTIPEAEDETSVDSDPENLIPLKRKRGKPTTHLPSKRRRTASAKHMPEFVDTQSRCRHCHINKSRTRCTTCDITLCLTKDRNCYKLFHE